MLPQIKDHAIVLEIVIAQVPGFGVQGSGYHKGSFSLSNLNVQTTEILIDGQIFSSKRRYVFIPCS
jgi:hypothetical protein